MVHITPALYNTSPFLHPPYITPVHITLALYYTGPILIQQPNITLSLYYTGPYYTDITDPYYITPVHITLALKKLFKAGKKSTEQV